MNSPRVAAVMITANRQVFARRAIDLFLRQTYRNCFLLVYDSGDRFLSETESYDLRDAVRYIHDYNPIAKVGALRNRANAYAVAGGADIICHWDDDDFSRPERIAQQVVLLGGSGADVVGYNTMYFYRSPQESWLYQNRDDPNPEYVIGTSFCYWARAWVGRPFLEDVPWGEDNKWITGEGFGGGHMLYEPLKVVGVISHGMRPPVMVARMHDASITGRAGHRRKMEPPFHPVVDDETRESLRKVMEI